MLSGTEERVVPDHEGQLNAGRPWTDEDCSALFGIYTVRAALWKKSAQNFTAANAELSTELLSFGPCPHQACPCGPPMDIGGRRASGRSPENVTAPLHRLPRKSERTSFAIFCRLEKRQGNAARGEENLFSDQLPPWRYEDTKKLRQMFQQGKVYSRKWRHTFTVPKAAFPPDCFILGLTKSAPIHLSAAPSEK